MEDNTIGSPARQELDTFFEPIIIRYDGLDAEKHTVDLADFGKSCQGIAKTIATVAHFIATGNYRKKSKKLSCRVIATTSRENCYSYTGIIKMIDASPLLYTTFGGLAVALGIGVAKAFGICLSYIGRSCSKRPITREELESMIKSHSDAPQNIGQETINKLIVTLDKMTEGLLSASRDSVKPIGHSCDTLKFGNQKKEYFLTLDVDDKLAITGEDFDVTPEDSYRVLISEYDMKQATCKISLVDDLNRRFKATIVDPQAELPNNPYATAMNQHKIITIRAKQKVYKCVVREFIISDIGNDNLKTSS